MAKKRRNRAERPRRVDAVKRVVRGSVTRPRRQYSSLTKPSLVPIFRPERAIVDLPAHRPVWVSPPAYKTVASEVVAPRPSPLFRPWGELPVRKLFKSPCISRKQRRAVIFARGLRAKGSGAVRRRFTSQSKETC